MKKSFVFLIGVIVLLAGIFTSCSLLGLKSVNKIEDWNPMADGKTFIYNYKYYENDVLMESEQVTEEINSVIQNDNLTIISIDDWYQIIDRDNNCIWEGDDSYVTGSDNNILLKTPIEVGNTWDDGAINEITKVNATETIAAGTFSDLILVEYIEEWSGCTEKSFYYYSPSVGRDVYYYMMYIYDDGDTIVEIYELDDVY